MSESLKINSQKPVSIQLTEQQRAAAYRRNIVLFALAFFIAAGAIHFLLGIDIIPGETDINTILISGGSFLLLGIIFSLLLYKVLPFMQEPGYTTSMQYAGVITVGVLLVVLFSSYLKGNINLFAALFYASLFLLPYTFYQNWIFYKIISAPVVFKSWYLPEPVAIVPAATVFLNSIPLNLQLSSAPNLPEDRYQVVVPGRLSIGSMFSDFIYDPQQIRQEPIDFERIKQDHDAWAFFTPGFANIGLRQLDANLNLYENGIKSNAIIIARRVQDNLPAQLQNRNIG